MNVAYDSGHSAMKAMGNNCKVRVPSAVHTVHDEDVRHPDAVRVDDLVYVVGEAAVSSGHDRDPVDRNGFHGSHQQRVEICYALQRMGVPDGTHEMLVASLPFGQARDSNVIARVCGNKVFSWHDCHGTAHKVTFEKVDVIAQGVGALRRFEASEGRPAPDRTLVVDVGSTTLDVVLLVRDRRGAFGYHKNSDSHREANVSWFKRSWTEFVRRKDGIGDLGMSYHYMLDRAERMQLTLPSAHGTINIKAEFMRAKEAYTRAVREAVESIVGRSGLAEAEAIVLTGGGAELIDRSLWADSRIVKSGVWANVEGQYLTSVGAHVEEDSGKATLAQVVKFEEV